MMFISPLYWLAPLYTVYLFLFFCGHRVLFQNRGCLSHFTTFLWKTFKSFTDESSFHVMEDRHFNRPVFGVSDHHLYCSVDHLLMTLKTTNCLKNWKEINLMNIFR
jgi:hypothetical protein